MKIIIAGDICVTPDAMEILQDYKATSVFAPIGQIIHNEQDNYAVFNMECPATDCVTKALKVGPCHKTKPDVIDYLSDVGFCCASIANNHIFDYGQEGLNDTIEEFKKNGIDIIGGLSSPHRIIEHNGIKVGIISFVDDEFNGNGAVYTQINVFDPLEAFDQISALKQICTYVVVIYHGGMEHYEYPTPYLQKICRKMVSAGADFVTCQHSHCIGCEEVFEGKHILYGQGNTYFFRKNNQGEKWNSGIVVELKLMDKIDISYSYIQTGKQGYISAVTEGIKIQEGFKKRSEEIKKDGFIAQNFSTMCRDTNRTVAMLCFLSGRGKIGYFMHRVLKGKILKLVLNQEKTLAMSNVVRCAVHREVIQEILRRINFRGGI